jgi:hypothetical protein
LAASQGQLLHGVHLPNVVRLMGPLGVGLGAPSRWRYRGSTPTQPTLQRAFAGHGFARMALLEDHPQKAGAPRRVLLAQPQRFLNEGAGLMLGPGAAPFIRRRHRLGAQPSKTLHQSPNRARGQLELLGNVAGEMPLLGTLGDHLPHGQGN